MNRATKRLLAKQQAAESRKGGGGAGGFGRTSVGGEDGDDRRRRYPVEKKKRTPPRQFVREVRTELKKVAWPSRKEVATYTTVVLISVIFLTVIVFGIDYGLSKAVFKTFTQKKAPATAPANQGIPGQGIPGQGIPGQGIPGQGIPGQGNPLPGQSR